jgi:predicted O-linked N-acetylglucosamine transferase (SPINDLY family)
LAEESYQLFQKLLDQECRSIAALPPRTSLSVFFREAKALLQAQDWSGAITCYQTALAHYPQEGKIYCNLGAIWQQQGQIEQAIAAYQRAIEYQPQLWVAYQNLVGLYNQTGDFQAAKELVLAALEHHPQVALLHLLLGDIYRFRAETTLAIAAYRTALRWDDQCVSAYQNLGGLLMMVNQIEGAKVCFKKALAIQPALAGVYRNLGEIYEAEGNYSKALECFNYSLSLEPEELGTLYRREHLRLTLCDWTGYEVRMQALLQRLHTDGMTELAPLSLNCFPALPALHKTINQSWSAAIAQRMAIVRQQLGFQYSHRHPEKLRLGYLSADFRNHAVGSLIAPLFQYHDRSQFEIYAYSLSTSQDETTEQIKQGCDYFCEIAPLSAQAAAQQIYQDGIQILIDLGGYTRLCRPEILALQPAPLQIHYLGYPDTMGAEFVPYILADRQLIPAHLAAGYTESLVELPHTFVTAPLSLPQPPHRQTLGLPDPGVVYACFNRTDKFSPDLFARWMAILQAVPDSVLWLAETGTEITTNLRQEAQRHGVDPQRLVFLPKQPLPEFMQLCQQADLFLDTFVYNAGATAVCALQAGVPILTCAGETFAARMGASICQAAQLEEFICPTPAEYQTQGIYWGQHPQQLRAVQERLRTQKAQLPLFQPQAWVRALETQLLALLNRQGAIP